MEYFVVCVSRVASGDGARDIYEHLLAPSDNKLIKWLSMRRGGACAAPTIKLCDSEK